MQELREQSKGRFGAEDVVMKNVRVSQKDLNNASLGDASSELDDSSDADDKTDPSFWRKDGNYTTLPENVRAAIDLSLDKSKHSDFYYKLRGLNERIKVFKSAFYNKVPYYQRVKMKEIEIKQKLQDHFAMNLKNHILGRVSLLDFLLRIWKVVQGAHLQLRSETM